MSSANSVQVPSFIMQGIVESQVSLQGAVQTLADLQVASIRATLAALSLEQRDSYCQSLRSSGYTPSEIAALADKSYPTISRHLNGKNS